MVIRPLTRDDAAAYVALRREMLADAPWAFSASPEDDVALDASAVAGRLGEGEQAIIGAFDEQGQLVGAAGLLRERRRKLAHRARVWGVYVSPTARGRGVGAAIMRRVLDTARAWPGVSSVGLSASTNSVAALALYRSLGFETWGVEPDCLRLDAGRCFDEVHLIARLHPRGGEQP